MENQDVYSIYNLYKEGYNDIMSRRSEDEIAGYKDPGEYLEEEPPYNGPSGEPYKESEYSVRIERDDAGRREYILYRGSKFIDSYLARSSEDETSAMERLARENNISLSEIEGYDGEENAEDIRGFSIGNELFNLYSNLDRDARTRSGSSVSEELKMIIDELDEIVSRAEQGGSKFDLIKQLRLD